MNARLDYLDSVRGVAALAVLIGHYFGGYGVPSFLPPWLWQTPFSIARDGFAAVAMFFVLSGLVLSLKYIRLERPFRAGWRDLASFYIARIARILGPFVAVVWLSAALHLFLYPPQPTTPPASAWLSSFWTSDPTVGNLIKQSFLFIRMGSDRLLPQDWTLTVEMNLSLWMPFLILTAAHSFAGLLLFSAVGIVFLKVNGFLFAFVMGIGLAKYFDRLKDSAFVKRPMVFLGLLSVGLFLYSYRYSKELLPAFIRQPFNEIWLWYITEIGALMMLMALIGSPRLQHVLDTKPLTYLGRISYSFYLWHFAVLLCFTPRFFGFLSGIGPVSTDAARCIGLLATVAVTIGVSDLSFRFIEKPSIQLGKRLNLLVSSRS